MADREDNADRYEAWFGRFVAQFRSGSDEDRRNIALKEEHTRHVQDNARVIACGMGLGRDELALAGVIALFHDIGRFPQYQAYRTFRDSDSVNHAALGARILIEHRVLQDLPREEQDLVVRAVTLHNVFVLPDGLEARLGRHARIVRDADKLDIWRIFTELFSLPGPERPSAADLGLPDTPGYSQAVLDQLRGREMVKLTDLRCLNDFKLLQLAWTYDLNFLPSFRLLDDRRLIDRLTATLPKNEDIRSARDAVQRYVDERLHP